MTTGRRQTLVGAVIVIAAVAVCFGSLLSAGFSGWDDPHTVADNPLFRPVKTDTFAYYWSHPAASIYIPLTYTVWASIAWATALPGQAGHDPLFFHLTNVVLHAAAALVVFLIIRRLTPSSIAAVAGGLLWAIHPLQTEAVGWVSGLKDVFCGLLSLLAVWQFISFRQETGLSTEEANAPVARPRSPLIPLMLTVLFFILAMLAKPSAMSLPLVMLAFDKLLFKQPLRRSLRVILPLLLLAVPLAIVAKLSQPASGTVSPLWARPLIALDAISFYLTKIILPTGLCLDYGRSPTRLTESGIFWHTWGIGVVTIAAAAFCSVRKISPLPLLAMAVFLIPILPVLGLVRSEFQTYSVVADHYLYVAMLGPSMLFAAGVAVVTSSESSRVRSVGVVVTATVLLALAGLTARQTLTWQSNETILQQVLRVNPNSVVGNINLGLERAHHGQLRQAVMLVERGVALDPDNLSSRFVAGDVYLEAGQVARGQAELENSLALYQQKFRPDDTELADAHSQVATVFARHKMRELAVKHARAAYDLNANDVTAEALRRVQRMN